MKGIFDTHAHYFDARFEKEFEGGADAVLAEVFANGVEYIVNVGTNLATSRAAIAQAARYDGMYAAAGIHPEDYSAVLVTREILTQASHVCLVLALAELPYIRLVVTGKVHRAPFVKVNTRVYDVALVFRMLDP
jgi:TatD DNase family protein